jgi:hypothetical protein
MGVNIRVIKKMILGMVMENYILQADKFTMENGGTTKWKVMANFFATKIV